jgi:hypothetical protein
MTLPGAFGAFAAGATAGAFAAGVVIGAVAIVADIFSVYFFD